MTNRSITTDILDALRDLRHSGHLNAAAAAEIERLRAALRLIANAHPDAPLIAREALRS